MAATKPDFGYLYQTETLRISGVHILILSLILRNVELPLTRGHRFSSVSPFAGEDIVKSSTSVL